MDKLGQLADELEAESFAASAVLAMERGYILYSTYIDFARSRACASAARAAENALIRRQIGSPLLAYLR